MSPVHLTRRTQSTKLFPLGLTHTPWIYTHKIEYLLIFDNETISSSCRRSHKYDTDMNHYIFVVTIWWNKYVLNDNLTFRLQFLRMTTTKANQCFSIGAYNLKYIVPGWRIFRQLPIILDTSSSCSHQLVFVSWCV